MTCVSTFKLLLFITAQLSQVFIFDQSVGYVCKLDIKIWLARVHLTICDFEPFVIVQTRILTRNLMSRMIV